MCLSALVAVVLGILLLASAGPPEPVSNGKSLGEWFAIVCAGKSTNQSAAYSEIYSLGTNAMPFLMDRLERRESLAHRLHGKVWDKLPASLQSRVPRPADVPSEWMFSMSLLMQWRTNSQPAVSAVLALTSSAQSGVTNGVDLSSGAWLDVVTGSWPRMFGSARPTPFGPFPSTNYKSQPQLRMQLTVIALTVIGGDDPRIIDLILTHVTGTSKGDALRASLPQLAPAIRKSIPAIESAFHDPEKRNLAILLLSQVSGEGFKLVAPMYIEMLQDPSDHIRWHAVTKLHQVGAGNREVVMALTNMLAAEPKWNIRGRAATALGALGDPAAIPALRAAAANDEWRNVRDPAADALKLLEQGKPATPQ